MKVEVQIFLEDLLHTLLNFLFVVIAIYVIMKFLKLDKYTDKPTLIEQAEKVEQQIEVKEAQGHATK
jgi:large-conductance mechanosensitive channel